MVLLHVKYLLVLERIGKQLVLLRVDPLQALAVGEGLAGTAGEVAL